MPYFIYATLSKEENDDFLAQQGFMAQAQWYENKKSELYRRLSDEDKSNQPQWYDWLKEGKIHLDGSL